MSIKPLISSFQCIKHHYDDCQFEIQFQMQQGQFLHSIFVGQGEHRISWLRSIAAVTEAVENNSERIQSDDMSYPAFQELSIQTDQQNRSTAFLIGQSNQIHWSMSVQLDPQQHRLTFEVAARIASDPSSGSIASGYQVLTSNSELNQLADRFSMEHEFGNYTLQSTTADQQSTVNSPLTLNVADQVLRFSDGLDLCHEMNQLPRTVAWKYALFWKKR